MTILITIVVLGFIIFFHELGHFLLAKLMGVRVLQFSLGFPPKALSKKIGETEYVLGIIPLGGYVKMAGEQADDEPSNPWDYSSKSVWAKITIIFAGPFFNFILGLLLLTFIFTFWGLEKEDLSRPVIGGVADNTPAHSVGILPSDSIISINDAPVVSWDSLRNILMQYPEQEITIRLSRKGKELQLPVKLSSKLVNGRVIGILGVYPSVTNTPYSLLSAFGQAIKSASAFFAELIKFFVRLFAGKVSFSELGGPILIARMTGQSAKLGIRYLLMFVAFLTINLAFINLLPIPMLDGGHLGGYVIEIFRDNGRCIEEQKHQTSVQKALS